ncbi:hypothetical protein [Rheinheimera sp. WS51]|uniref:hypothetical protein n=1 Tax=Rheinheimera sp. WS51 TaxID=3425886 RepID=UPI003D94A7E9
MKKSQLAGFFFLLFLSSCQPAATPEPDDNSLMQQAKTDQRAANTLAAKRLSTNEITAAIHWFKQAASLGDHTALLHALQLQQRLEGKLATAQWLAEFIASNEIKLHAISEQQRHDLGFWLEDDNLPSVSPYISAKGCSVTIQPIASQLAGVKRWQQLSQQWQQDTMLANLPVCFSALQLVDSTVLQCSEQAEQRISCHYQALQPWVNTTTVSQVAVIAGRGKASFNNGIIQLPENATLALLRHEFFHLLGFIDEYKLALPSAEQVCLTDQLYPNIVLNKELTAYLDYWQLAAAEISLTKVDTCAAIGVQAYRIVDSISPMHFYESDMPAVYWLLAEKVLQQPEKIMPVQYYFAYLARQKKQWILWRTYMRQAAELGYADAQQAINL